MLKQAMELLIRMGEAAHGPRIAAERQRFLSLGDVLKDAEVEVHSVVQSTPPPEEPEWEIDDPDPTPEREGPLQWYLVELTIRPAQTAGRDVTWEPVGLVVAGPDSQSGAAGAAADAERDRGEIYEVQIWGGQEWKDAYTAECAGTQRLRLQLGVPNGVDTVRLRYHFEVFGEVRLSPGHPLAG